MLKISEVAGSLRDFAECRGNCRWTVQNIKDAEDYEKFRGSPGFRRISYFYFYFNFYVYLGFNTMEEITSSKEDKFTLKEVMMFHQAFWQKSTLNSP